MERTEQITMAEFIRRHGITMQAEWADANPNMVDDEWARTASHWKCTFRRPGHTMTTYFSMGSAHTKEPTAADVLDSLASDSAGAVGDSFEDWCGEYGYDTDSRKAERTYKACQRTGAKLATFLEDPDAYRTLLYNTERL